MIQEHRKKLTTCFEDNQDAIIYIKGADIIYRYGTDFEFPFRQESNFLYLTGVNEPGFAAIIDLKSGEYQLIAPKRDAQYAVWHGFIVSKEENMRQYQPDNLLYDTELETYLKKRNPRIIYTLNIEQSQDLIQIGYNVNAEVLTDALTDCRVIKTAYEIEQLDAANHIASRAHCEVIDHIKSGLKEYHLKAIYKNSCAESGLFQEPYNGIYGTGINSAVLHYTYDSSLLNDGDLFLIDAGAEVNGYAADITRTYPINGRFTDIQAQLYQACLNAHQATIEACKPGIKMEDLHYLAARTILDGIKAADLVYGDTDELMEANIFALFFPHGLGHFLGLDTHDVGGYPKGIERINRPGIKYLRIRRTMEPGMVITIEPGIYIIPALLNTAFEESSQSKYLNREKLTSLFNFGGIRIEDNILITEDAYYNFTNVPKTIDQITTLMSS